MIRVLHIIYSASMMLLKIPYVQAYVQWSELDSIIATLQPDTLKEHVCWKFQHDTDINMLEHAVLGTGNGKHELHPTISGRATLVLYCFSQCHPSDIHAVAVNLESSFSTDHLLICHYYMKSSNFIVTGFY